jgi:hypothetical protein
VAIWDGLNLDMGIHYHFMKHLPQIKTRYVFNVYKVFMYHMHWIYIVSCIIFTLNVHFVWRCGLWKTSLLCIKTKVWFLQYYFVLTFVHHDGCLMTGRMEFQLHSLSLGKTKKVKTHNVSKKMYFYFSTFCIISGEFFICFHVMFCETHKMIFWHKILNTILVTFKREFFTHLWLFEWKNHLYVFCEVTLVDFSTWSWNGTINSYLICD